MSVILEAKVLERKNEILRNVLRFISGGASAYFVVNAVSWCFGKAGFEPGWKWFAFILVVAPMLVAIFIRLTSTGKFLIRQLSGGQLEILIEQKNGNGIHAKGNWSYVAQYRKIETKYGLKAKFMYLKLYCNQKPFCVLRHDRKPIEKSPAGFDLVDEVFISATPIYFCKKTYEVYLLMEKINQQTMPA
jgi:hypothetical protein